MANEKKELQVKSLKEKLQKATGVFFCDYQGLSVNDMSSLRHSLLDCQSELVIAKNTLLHIADPRFSLTGPTAVLLTFGDPMAPLKIIRDFKKKNKLPNYKTALFEGKIIDAETVNELAELPGKEVLIAQILGLLNSPLTNLLSLLTANQRNLVYALNEISQKK